MIWERLESLFHSCIEWHK